MKTPFQQFEYRLNIGPKTQENTYYTDQSNKNNNLISLKINSDTNISQLVLKTCAKHSLNEDLIDILILAIQQQIENQIVLNRDTAFKKQSQQKTLKNKSKNFKNKFCSYLQQIQSQEFNQTQTFRNTEFVIDSSIEMNQSEKQKFRPTILKILDMEDTQDQQNYQISQFQFNHPTANTSSNKSIFQQTSQINQTVFDQLYNQYREIEKRKQQERKKSFSKTTFKPSLNKNSEKIVQLKKYIDSQNVPIWERSAHKYNRKLSQSSLQKSIPKPLRKQAGKIQHKENIIIKKKLNESKVIENPFEQKKSIYERGQIYRKKSQQKLIRMKQSEILQQIKNCTFKPVLNSKRSKRNTEESFHSTIQY